MKKIAKENIKDIELNWDGLLVSVPKNGKAIFYDSDFYMYSKYINHFNKTEYHRFDYNKEDSDLFATCKISSLADVIEDFDNFNWYQFRSMTDFCKWYLEDREFTVERKETTAKLSTYEKVKEEVIKEW